MAKVNKAVRWEFEEVNISLFEIWRLKEQKVSSGEIVCGTLSLKQRHMKPLCSLSDEQELVEGKMLGIKKLKSSLRQSGQ